MDNNNKFIAKEMIRKLKPEGQTNIWHALKKGMDLMKLQSSAERNPAIFLLTDGAPNINPNRGEENELKRYIEKFGNISVINTFGFGYSLDSILLNNLSLMGNGSYSFIPDSGMVGTIFVKAIANHFSTCS